MSFCPDLLYVPFTTRCEDVIVCETLRGESQGAQLASPSHSFLEQSMAINGMGTSKYRGLPQVPDRRMLHEDGR